jgi:predicted RNase H-like HicB family nuclease
MQLSFVLRPERDGRWSAKVVDLPETRAFGSTPEEATARAKAQALEVLAQRLSTGAIESLDVAEITFVPNEAAPSELAAYVEAAMKEAVIESLEDGTFVGRIPPCPGVIAFAGDPVGCGLELRSALQDWVASGLKLGHELPVIGGIRLHDRSKSTDPVGAL